MCGGGQDKKNRTQYTLLAVLLLMDVCCTVGLQRIVLTSGLTNKLCSK